MFDLRSATVDDVKQIAEINVAAWRAAYRGLISDEGLASLSVESIAKNYVGYLTAPGTSIFLLEEAGEAVGYVHVCLNRDADKDPSKIGEVAAIYVHPTHWRKGYGEELMKKAMEQLRDSAFTELSLWVLEGNTATRKFYEKLGLAFDGSKKVDQLRGIEVREVRYCCKLVTGG